MKTINQIIDNVYTYYVDVITGINNSTLPQAIKDELVADLKNEAKADIKLEIKKAIAGRKGQSTNNVTWS